MRRILSILSLPLALACVTPDHTPTRPQGFPGLRGTMNHLPDGRWQFVVEIPNPERRRKLQVECLEPVDIQMEPDAPYSRATWLVEAARVEGGRPFLMKLWADGEDFPIQVQFPRGGKDYGTEGALTLVALTIINRR